MLLIHCDSDAIRNVYRDALAALFILHYGSESTVQLFGISRSTDADLPALSVADHLSARSMPHQQYNSVTDIFARLAPIALYNAAR